MSRFPLIDPAQASGRVKEVFEGPLKGKTSNIFRAMANAPAALDAYLGMAGALAHGQLRMREREVIHLATGELNGCDYCIAAHTVLGMRAGLSEEQTREARRGRMSDPTLDALVGFVRSLHERRGMADERAIDKLRGAGYSEAQIIEAVANYALASFTNYFNHINETPIDFPPAATVGSLTAV